jgi:hypothetical protein
MSVTLGTTSFQSNFSHSKLLFKHYYIDLCNFLIDKIITLDPPTKLYYEYDMGSTSSADLVVSFEYYEKKSNNNKVQEL